MVASQAIAADSNGAGADFEKGNKIGIARMRRRVINNRFIGDLTTSGKRQLQPGAPKIAAQLAAASTIEAGRSASRRYLAASIRAGEKAQTVRDRETLERVAEAVRRLPLNSGGQAVGDYYFGLSLCRRGPEYFGQANSLFCAVADNGPTAFRAKALVALGSNMAASGDVKASLSIHEEASRIAKSCGDSDLVLPVAFHLGMNRIFISIRDGNHQDALVELERLLPIASTIGQEFPALMHHYQNNLATGLADAGRLEESQHVAGWLMRSPYLDLYPESRRTCEEIESKTRKPSRNIVFIGQPFTGAVDESSAADADEARNQAVSAELDRTETETTRAQTLPAEPAPLRATVAAVLLEFASIIIQPAFPSTSTGAIRAPWPARRNIDRPAKGTLSPLPPVALQSSNLSSQSNHRSQRSRISAMQNWFAPNREFPATEYTCAGLDARL